MKLKIGCSACLLGIHCRYDGGEKLCSAVFETLKEKVQLIPVCPEYNCGLGTPRPPMRLTVTPRGTRVVIPETGEDKTAELTDWINVEVKLMKRAGIAGFIFKSKSPSCGLCSTKLFSPAGKCISETGTGLFAAAMKRAYPEMTFAQECDFPEAAKYFIL